MSRPWGLPLAAALVVAAGVPCPGSAQQDTLMFRDGAETRRVFAFLDSMGVVATGGADQEAVRHYLESVDLAPARRLPAGTLLAAVPPHRRSGDSIAALVSRLREERPETFVTGGSLAIVEGARFPVVLSDELVVRWSPGVSEAQIDSVRSLYGMQERSRGMTTPLRRLYRVTGHGGGTLFALAELLWASPLTSGAYPHFYEGIREAAPWTPNDPFFGEQWHLTNATGVGHIDAPAAWDVTKGDPSVVLAIIEVYDFDVTHPDLVANLWVNTGEVAGNGVDDDGNGCIDDVHGCLWNECPGGASSCGVGSGTDVQKYHGTAVAGLSAAVGDNGIGVTGVCPRCRLMLLSVAGGEEGRKQAFEYALANGASVVNASWEMNRSSSLDEVIETVSANGRAGRGMPIVFAAGNYGVDACATGTDHPSIPNTLAVGASNNLDQRIAASNFGDCLDLLAPGGWSPSFWGVTSTDQPGDPGYNLDERSVNCPLTALADRAYTRCFGGTSASAPIVTGVIGLMLAENPTLTREQVRDILIRTADKIDCVNAAYVPACPPAPGSPAPYAFSLTHAYGRVNAAGAVAAASLAGSDLVAKSGPAGTLEIGARAGWTRVSSASSDRTTTSVPGSGATSEPALHVAWLTGGGHVMLEAQGWASRSGTTNPSTDEKGVVLAAQASYLFGAGSASPYAGASLAYEHRSGSSASTLNDSAWGVHLGYRWRFATYLAGRVEGRYRWWSAQALAEWGVAVGLGVLVH